MSNEKKITIVGIIADVLHQHIDLGFGGSKGCKCGDWTPPPFDGKFAPAAASFREHRALAIVAALAEAGALAASPLSDKKGDDGGE